MISRNRVCRGLVNVEPALIKVTLPISDQTILLTVVKG